MGYFLIGFWGSSQPVSASIQGKCNTLHLIPLQVYLGKWQETDVAIKVLTEIQSLCSGEGVQPQDPATLHSWKGDGPPPRQGGNKANHAGGLKVITDDTGNS